MISSVSGVPYISNLMKIISSADVSALIRASYLVPYISALIAIERHIYDVSVLIRASYLVPYLSAPIAIARHI